MLTDISNINQKLAYTKQMQNDYKGHLNKVFQQMKIQLKALKKQNQLLKCRHKQQIEECHKEITSLKKKVSYFSQKQMIKVLLNADQEQEIKKQLKQIKIRNIEYCELIRTLNIENQSLKKKIFQLQNQTKVLKESLQTIKYQKQKHLQLSIMQKIQIEQINQVLQKDIKSKANIIINLKNQLHRITQKQVDLVQQQRKLKKKEEQIKEHQTLFKNINQFNQQKIQSKFQTVLKQNQFLKAHIKKLEKNNVVQCNCSSQHENIKNKYISKSRELSKIKMNFSKQLFKENMSAKLRQNLQNINKSQREQEQILFKLTQNSDTEEKQILNKNRRDEKQNKKWKDYKKIIKN